MRASSSCFEPLSTAAKRGVLRRKHCAPRLEGSESLSFSESVLGLVKGKARGKRPFQRLPIPFRDKPIKSRMVHDFSAAFPSQATIPKRVVRKTDTPSNVFEDKGSTCQKKQAQDFQSVNQNLHLQLPFEPRFRNGCPLRT